MLRVLCDGRLFGAVSGTGRPTVLALHGWARTHADFDELLRGFDGLAVDLPGFGASPPPPTAWGSAEYAGLVAGVLAEMDGPVVLVGHSFGGGVAVHLAATHPERIGAVVLTGVPRLVPLDGPRAKPKLPFRLGRRLHRWGLVGEDRMEALRRKYGARDYAAASGVMRDVNVRVLNEVHEDQLRLIRVPVELVWGADDTAAPLAGAERAAALLPYARLTVIPGAGHMTPATAPHALAEAIRRHVP